MIDRSKSAASAKVAGLWLLPELTADHVVKSNVRKDKDGGYKRRGETTAATKKKRVLPRALTAERLEQLEQQAREEGFEAGRAEGYQTGYSEGELRAKQLGEEQTLQQKQALSALIDSAVTEVETHVARVEQSLVEIIAKISQELCQRELATDRQTITDIVKQAIAALPLSEKQVSILLNPSDVVFLERLNGFVKPQWALVGDESIQVGGVKLLTENSLVDFSVSARLSAIIGDTFNQQVNVQDIPSQSNSDSND